jgi:hypothetical protein
MPKLKDKLNARLDKLQELMESDYHLKNPDEVLELIRSISFAWRVLSEADRDYVQACEYAIEEGVSWDA